MSWQARLFSSILRNTFKRRLAAAKDMAAARAVLNSGVFKVPHDVHITPDFLGGVQGEWVESTSGSNRMTLLYLHGGGYFACSAKSHRAATTFFARQGFRVFAPNYRLAPEHPFPAGLDDAQAVYAALIDRDIHPSRLAVAGDSAGGGLSLALMLRLREHGLPQPAAAALFSPLTDLAGTGASRVSNDQRCAMFYGTRMALGAELYLAGADPRTPLASPLFADLRGLPPLLIHVGADEILLDDSTRLAERAREAGVAVELRVWQWVPHVWQLFHWFIPEGRESLGAAAAFCKQHIVFSSGLMDEDESVNRKTAAQPDYEMAIIGGGFSGLGMAIQMKKAGRHSFVLLEKASDIGGTWRENTYPGCACDVPSHMYSFSYERKADWSRMYSTQPEIWNYLKDCAEKYGLAPYISFGVEMAEAVFDEANDMWQVRTTDGRVLTARTVVSALGALSRPSIPKLPGVEKFQGVAFHSAEWNHAYPLEGKCVAVIGTGASVIQFLPQIAPQVSQLTLFQRTPAWVLPKPDRAIGRIEQAIYQYVPGAIGLFRNFIYWRQELTGLGFVHPKLMSAAKRLALRHMRHQIPYAALREKLTPTYTIGCKRVLLSNDYYPALTRPNVEVVTSGVAQVRGHSIVSRDGIEHPVDAIIYGTGFRVTDLLTPVRILGRDGIDLNDAWRSGPEAYRGVMAAGYPNLFMLLGPNTGLGHNSVVFMVEQQIRYVMKCLRLMRKKGVTSIEPRPDRQKAFNSEIQRRLQSTVWASGCKSWYQTESGKNVTLWPGFTFQYWKLMRKVNLQDLRLGVSYARAFSSNCALNGEESRVPPPPAQQRSHL